MHKYWLILFIRFFKAAEMTGSVSAEFSNNCELDAHAQA